MSLDWDYLVGDVRTVLMTLPENSIQCIVTSPPYWGLRDYGIPPSIWGGLNGCEHEWSTKQIIVETTENARWQHNEGGYGQNRYKKEGRRANEDRTYEERPRGSCQCGAWRGCLGLEPTPEMFIEHMVEVCGGLWRVLRDDGTFWLNLGDSYASGGRGQGGKATVSQREGNAGWHSPPPGLKHKDLVMMPHRVALALQEDGWWVRSTVVWSKPNPMPESCQDRPTSAHEYIFLLTKNARYFYDGDAVREPLPESSIKRYQHAIDSNEQFNPEKHKNTDGIQSPMEILTRAAKNVIAKGSRNLRNVWHIPTQSFSGAHFATFPEKIPETCILAGSRPGDTVLDPFAGSGTTLKIARKLGRSAIGIDISEEYKELAQERAMLNVPNIKSFA